MKKIEQFTDPILEKQKALKTKYDAYVAIEETIEMERQNQIFKTSLEELEKHNGPDREKIINEVRELIKMGVDKNSLGLKHLEHYFPELLTEKEKMELELKKLRERVVNAPQQRELEAVWQGDPFEQHTPGYSEEAEKNDKRRIVELENLLEEKEPEAQAA